MNIRGASRLLLITGSSLSLALAGCYGDAALQTNTPFGPQVDGPPEDPEIVLGEALSCDGVTADGETVESVAQLFATTVHPTMVRGEGGCTECHAPEKRRTFVVTADPFETFYKARAALLLRDAPSTIFHRLVSLSPDAGMPLGGPKWAPAELRAVRDVVCKLDKVGGPAADEEFPRELRAAYVPPPDAGALYENTFLAYPQLQGKVKAIFADEWKRAGPDGGALVDQFAAHIGMFGGVDFRENFTEARVAKPEFLLALDKLSADVCAKAVADKTGPFAGTDPSLPLTDRPAPALVTVQAEAFSELNGRPLTNSNTQVGIYSNGTIGHTIDVPYEGSYAFNVRARATLWDGGGPLVSVKLDSDEVAVITVQDTALADHTFTAPLSAGPHALSLTFLNDQNGGGQDRNLFVDLVTHQGPAGGSTGTTRRDAANALVAKLYDGMLFRAPSTAETAAALTLINDLSAVPLSLPDAWAGLCEGLFHHPDFLFTRPPHHDTATGLTAKRLLLVKISQDLRARPPTAAELGQLESGKPIATFVDEFLDSAEFRDRYFYKLRIRTEADGTTETDEPARLWTHLTMARKPAAELLTGEYSVAPDFTEATRPAFHKKTGVLTMKGFIKNKQGLPHYNYPARVMSDFLGEVFEVPQEVFDQRQTSTASSTVDEQSICFACHQNLTPLAHQRLRWTDEGEYREVDDADAGIDDSDRGMVKTYAFRGQGLEAFSTAAVKKEKFVRKVINTNFEFLFGRPLRHQTDERGFYRELWDVMEAQDGDQKALLRAMLLSNAYAGGNP